MIAALVELVDFRSLVGFYRVYSVRLGRIYGVAARADFIAAIAATLGVLAFDTLPGLFVGIGVAIILLVYRSSRPHVATLGRIPGATGQFGDVERHPGNTPVPGVAILRPESGLYFANADRVREAIRQAAARSGVTHVIIDLGTVPEVDLTAARTLGESAEELQRNGRALMLAHDIGQVRDVLRSGGGGDVAAVYPTIEAAIEAAGQSDARSAPADPTR